MKAIHKRSIRMRNNAGIDFPVCQIKDVLDLSKTSLATTGDKEKVTCKKCKSIINKDRWR